MDTAYPLSFDSVRRGSIIPRSSFALSRGWIGSGAILVPTMRPSDAFISRLQKYGLKFRLYGVRSLGSYPRARGRSTHHAPKNHAKATEAINEDTEEPAPEPVTTEPVIPSMVTLISSFRRLSSQFQRRNPRWRALGRAT